MGKLAVYYINNPTPYWSSWPAKKIASHLDLVPTAKEDMKPTQNLFRVSF